VTAPLASIEPVDAIVIGTSAGGVEALSVLLPAIPRAYRGAVFVVLHLPRGRRSLLVDIFGPKCALAVREAEDKEPVVPGTIYFAPSDYHLLVDRGPELALSTDAPVNFSRPSIDVLFESAAEVYGPRLLGIILTGANEDGAAGLEAVFRAGGTTCVQDPSTAYAPQMSESALRRIRADHVLGLAELAQFLSTVVVATGPSREEHTST
jgi:two-component system chemotaxis response regulator CheB